MTDPNRPDSPLGEHDDESPTAAYGGVGVPAEPATASGDEAERDNGREMMAQLQGIIDNIATQAAPVVRQIGAKAAELAALAGEKAGPFAHRAAEATEAAGARLAVKGREVAADLRTREAREDGLGEGAGAGDQPHTIDTPDSVSTDR